MKKKISFKRILRDILQMVTKCLFIVGLSESSILLWSQQIFMSMGVSLTWSYLAYYVGGQFYETPRVKSSFEMLNNNNNIYTWQVYE